MSWEKINFGSLYLAPTRNGIYKDKSNHGSGVKIVNMGEIFAYDFIGNQDMQRIEMTPEEMQTSGLKESDLLFARRSLVESGAGKASIVTELSEPTTFESSIIRVRLDPTLCYPLFYLYWLRCLAGRAAIGALVTGLNVKGIRGSELKGMVVDYPPIETQKRIAGILKRYDDLIENNQKQIKLLEEAAQRLYKEWFVDLRFPGHETTPIIDGIPEGWKRDEVTSIIDLLSGFAFKSADFTDVGAYKIVTIKNVQDGMFDGHNVSRIAEVPTKMPKHCYLNDGDILLSLTGNVGRVCVVNGNNYLLNQRVAKLKSDYPAFAYCLFRSNDMFVEMGNLANGAAQQNLSPIKTGQIKILIPPVELLIRFEEVVTVYMKQMLNLNEQIELLQETRDRLLPKLMNGEIEV